MSNFYLKRNGKLYGPFSDNKVKVLINNGTFTEEDQITDDQIAWQTVDEFRSSLNIPTLNIAPAGYDPNNGQAGYNPDMMQYQAPPPPKSNSLLIGGIIAGVIAMFLIVGVLFFCFNKFNGQASCVCKLEINGQTIYPDFSVSRYESVNSQAKFKFNEIRNYFIDAKNNSRGDDTAFTKMTYEFVLQLAKSNRIEKVELKTGSTYSFKNNDSCMVYVQAEYGGHSYFWLKEIKGNESIVCKNDKICFSSRK